MQMMRLPRPQKSLSIHFTDSDWVQGLVVCVLWRRIDVSTLRAATARTSDLRFDDPTDEWFALVGGRALQVPSEEQI